MTPSWLSPFDHPIVSRRCFFPRPDPVPDPLLVSSHGVVLACRYVAPHPGAPTVLHFHGNGETAADYAGGPLEQALLAAGCNVCFAEYRGFGGSTGRPEMAAMLDDGEAIAAALGAASDQLVVFGRSMGSLYAIELAARRPGIAALVIESGIASPLHLVTGRVAASELGCSDYDLEAEALLRLDHRRKLGGYEGPLLLLHAAKDTLVPAENARQLHSFAKRADRRLVVFERGDHNSMMLVNWVRYVEELKALAASIR